jgi:sugar-specific transcriptional regulator TrmB
VQVYRNLRQLQNKYFIEPSTSWPAYFSATPIDKVLDLVAESKRKEAMLLGKSKASLIAIFEALQQQPPFELEKFVITENRNTIYSLIDQLIKKAQKEVIIMLGDASRVFPDYEESNRISKGAFKRVLTFRAIGQDNKTNREYTRRFMKTGLMLANFENRYSKINDDNFPCFFMADRKELLIQVEKDSIGYMKKAIITTNQALIALASLFFEEIWKNSELSEITLQHQQQQKKPT